MTIRPIQHGTTDASRRAPARPPPRHIALLDGHWREDADRGLSLTHAVAELKPRPEASDKTRVGPRLQNQAEVRDRVPRETVAHPRTNRTLPPLGAGQLLSGLLQPLAIARPTLVTLSVRETSLNLRHGLTSSIRTTPSAGSVPPQPQPQRLRQCGGQARASSGTNPVR